MSLRTIEQAHTDRISKIIDTVTGQVTGAVIDEVKKQIGFDATYNEVQILNEKMQKVEIHQTLVEGLRQGTLKLITGNTDLLHVVQKTVGTLQNKIAQMDLIPTYQFNI